MGETESLVMNAIGDDDPWRLHDQVIAQCLIEHGLVQFHIRSLQLEDHQGLTMNVMAHDVCKSFHTVQLDSVLHGNQPLRIAQIARQVMQPVLTHPFFRLQCYPTPAIQAENLSGLAIVGDLPIHGEGGQIEPVKRAHAELYRFT